MSLPPFARALVVMFLAFLPTSYAAENYEQHVRNLAAGTPATDIKASLKVLEAGGLIAFPALIAHFSDASPADPRFQRERMDRTANGALQVHEPTIGDVCFDILQGQIEGEWPKAFRIYHVLSPVNARAWLDTHAGLTLRQLQRAAREESLRRAQAALAKDPSAELLSDEVAFLRENLESVNGEKASRDQ